MAESADKGYVFTLVGATGAVGGEVLKILEERKFPVRELRLVASQESFGKTLTFRNEEIAVRNLTPDVFEGTDIAFFSAGSSISGDFVPIATHKGALVVDNTSAFRMEKDVPLAVPEVNGDQLAELPEGKIISVPNCATIQIVVALAPLHRKVGITRAIVSTYQSTSGAGRKAMDELLRQVSELFNYCETGAEVLPHRIAFNAIPQIGDFHADGITGEEAKIAEETRKILGDDSIGVSATTVRVATFHGHAASINIETRKPLAPEEARRILAAAPGVKLIDEEGGRRYPVLTDAVGRDEVYIGRVRRDPSRENCLNLWVVADNLRKGAALNGIQILEHLRSKRVL